MVEYSDFFDEVDEFQKKAKVTSNRSAAGVRTPDQSGCCLCEARNKANLVLMSFYIVRRRDSKNVYERGHDRIAARLSSP